MTPKPVDLERIKAYCEKATRAPWSWDCFTTSAGTRYHSILAVGGVERDRGKAIAETYHHDGAPGFRQRHGVQEDANFIADARTDLPACVEEIERLRSALDEIAVLTQNDKDPRICRIALDALGR